MGRFTTLSSPLGAGQVRTLKSQAILKQLAANLAVHCVTWCVCVKASTDGLLFASVRVKHEAADMSISFSENESVPEKNQPRS